MYPSIWQILIVLVILLLLFGHKRVRDLGKSLGEALREFKKGLESDDPPADKSSPSASPSSSEPPPSSSEDSPASKSHQKH